MLVLNYTREDMTEENFHIQGISLKEEWDLTEEAVWTVEAVWRDGRLRYQKISTWK